MAHLQQKSSLFISEEMTLIQLYIPYEIAQTTVAELGELGSVEFRDLNPDVNAFQRAFVNEIRRLDEMERQLRFLRAQCSKVSIAITPLVPQQSYALTRKQQEIDELEGRLCDHEARILQMNTSQEALNKRHLELTELRHVLRETAAFFEEAEQRQEDIVGGGQTAGNYYRQDTTKNLLDRDYDLEQGDEPSTGLLKNAGLGFVTGVIPRAKMGSFERILWRALRGNLYMNYAEIDEPIHDPVTDESVNKNVFIIFAHGKELLAKIRKICESLGASLYPVDDDPEKRREDALEVIARIEDLNNVLYNTQQTRRTELLKVAEALEIWETIVKKERAIYDVMNKFNYDVNRKCLIAEGWCPKRDVGAISYSLRSVTERTASTIPPLLNELRTTKQPPTFHRTNKFTSSFQSIIDAYGMAKYQEVNPGLYTIITFPFLFAVMFGDFGHGLLVTCAAAFMVLYERSLAGKKGEMFETLFGGRYLILLMGIFSMFTGLMYNDCFSRSLWIFGDTAWSFVQPNPAVEEWKGVMTGSVYPIGMDPIWHLADNALIFSNSYKMKMSIIMGVIHMSFGIVLTIFNYRRFRHSFGIWAEFIPQMLFLQSTFGYLVILIIYKWFVPVDGWGKLGDSIGAPTDINRSPPSLLNTLIDMFLSMGSVEDTAVLYSGQATVQTILVVIAIICVPWMLLAKPYYMKWEHARADRYSDVSTQNLDSPASSPGRPEEMTHEEQFVFSEVMINQTIHSIEFCLGCISNTASYLRLWALSLAHAQLSEVLWEMVLFNVFKMQNAVAIYIGFGAWFVLTCAILIGMEGLSAFLHALRLHWVEFNNKFYDGSGKKFIPFSFEAVLGGTSDD